MSIYGAASIAIGLLSIVVTKTWAYAFKPLAGISFLVAAFMISRNCEDAEQEWANRNNLPVQNEFAETKVMKWCRPLESKRQTSVW